jgi:predicted transcriptional regulator
MSDFDKMFADLKAQEKQAKEMTENLRESGQDVSRLDRAFDLLTETKKEVSAILKDISKQPEK